MGKYRNISGNSGVYSYEIGNDCIRVQFSSGQTYSYSYKKAGNHNVEKMKSLARKGSGLNSFINEYVKIKYD